MANIADTERVAQLPASAAPWARILEKLPALGMAVFVAALLFVGAHHEPWFDEAQAWLIARDASPWEIVSRYARYEGSPPLWHLLLWAPAHLGFPYRGLWLISGACACVGAWLVLFKSPFPTPVRLGMVFGYFFAFQYGVVARSYSLDLVLFPLAAWLFQDRLDRPRAYCAVLALLANTNAHCFLFSGLMFLEFAVAAFQEGRLRDRRVLAGALLFAGLALCALFSAWPPKDVRFSGYSPGYLSALRAVILMTEPFVDRWDIFSRQTPENLTRGIGLAITLLLFRPVFVLFAKARLIALFAAMCGVFLVFTTVEFGQPWHAGLLFLAWIFVLWAAWPKAAALSKPDRRALAIGLGVVLGVQDWYTAAAWGRDLVQTYSPGQAVASALADHGRAHPGYSLAMMGVKGFAVQPWAPQNLFWNYNGHAARPAFYDWRKSQPLPRDPTPGAWKRLIDDGGYDVVLLSASETMEPKDVGQYFDLAAKAGYCPRTFPGDMVWKTYNIETEWMTLFTRCPAARGAGPAKR